MKISFLDTTLLLFHLSFVQITFGQDKIIKIDNVLEINKISEHTFIHICDGSNGIIYINSGEAIIVSTPPTDETTESLINWVKDSLNAEIKGFIIDSWHPDNMEGLDIVNKFGIKSYSNESTQQIAKAKGLPIPQVGIPQKMEFNVGNRKLVARYFGPAHTDDGIVVWIPDEKILFGSNAVRNYNGWIGNIGDADVNKWSETIEKIRDEYITVKTVIPGHGNYGGPELLDYTINLYKPSKWGTILKQNNIRAAKIFSDYGDIFVSAEQDSVAGQIHFLKNAVVFADKGSQYVKIESNSIKYDQNNNGLKSDYGRLWIINKKKESSLQETDGYYKNLILNLRDDAIGITIILKELMR